MRFRTLALIAVILAGGCGSGDGEPTLGFGSNAPGDLRQLATEVFATVAETLPARAGCLDGVVVSGAWELEDRARYAPEVEEITVRIPATAAQLEISIVHELTHHIEFACPQDDETRREFMTAQGLDTDVDWFAGATWETTPSEQWATAVVLHVLGRPDERARVHIGADAMEIVATWATVP